MHIFMEAFIDVCLLQNLRDCEFWVEVVGTCVPALQYFQLFWGALAFQYGNRDTAKSEPLYTLRSTQCSKRQHRIYICFITSYTILQD